MAYFPTYTGQYSEIKLLGSNPNAFRYQDYRPTQYRITTEDLSKYKYIFLTQYPSTAFENNNYLASDMAYSRSVYLLCTYEKFKTITHLDFQTIGYNNNYIYSYVTYVDDNTVDLYVTSGFVPTNHPSGVYVYGIN